GRGGRLWLSITNSGTGMVRVTIHIRGRHGLDKRFLKIRSVLVSFIRKEALPTTPHASESGVKGGPVVAEVHGGHQAAQIAFNNLAFPLTVYQANTDFKFTLASGDEHSASFGYTWSPGRSTLDKH